VYDLKEIVRSCLHKIPELRSSTRDLSRQLSAILQATSTHDQSGEARFATIRDCNISQKSDEKESVSNGPVYGRPAPVVAVHGDELVTFVESFCSPAELFSESVRLFLRASNELAQVLEDDKAQHMCHKLLEFKSVVYELAVNCERIIALFRGRAQRAHGKLNSFLSDFATDALKMANEFDSSPLSEMETRLFELVARVENMKAVSGQSRMDTITSAHCQNALDVLVQLRERISQADTNVQLGQYILSDVAALAKDCESLEKSLFHAVMGGQLEISLQHMQNIFFEALAPAQDNKGGTKQNLYRELPLLR